MNQAKCMNCAHMGWHSPDGTSVSIQYRCNITNLKLEEMPYCPMEGESDQEAKKDAGKLRLSLVPGELIQAVGRVRTWATENKYKDPESYKQVEIDRYHDALLRHLYKYLEDPNSVDEESGLKHLDHIACNVAFLCELQKGES